MQRITIRHAKLNELARVVEITKRAYSIPYKANTPSSKPHEPDNINDLFSNKEFFIIISLVDDKIIGAVRYKFVKSRHIYLYKLVTLKSFRRKGIGAKLLDEVEKVALKNSCSKILLDCMQEKKLDDYYKKFGFKVEKVEPHHDHHDVYMFKNIKIKNPKQQ